MTLDNASGIRRYAEGVLSATSAARARTEILQQKRLFNISTSRDGKTISAMCEGSHPEDRYKVYIELGGDEPVVSCTCPAKEREALCKHCLGLLLWRAGNLTEERLRQRSQGDELSSGQAASPMQPGSAHAQTSASGKADRKNTDGATIAYEAADGAPAAAAATTPPPVVSTVVRAGKRRLPASFAARPQEPTPKKSKAKKEAAPGEATASPGADKVKGQVQSKLAFQRIPKYKQPPEAAEAAGVTGAANRAARVAHVKGNRRAAPAPTQLASAQSMLELSDSDLLHQCHVGINAVEGQLDHRPIAQSVHSLAAVGDAPDCGTAQHNQAQQSIHPDEPARQLKSQPATEVKPNHKADKLARPSATVTTGEMAGPSNAGQTSVAENAAESKGGERPVSSAATVSTGKAASPSGVRGASAQPYTPASTPLARSLAPARSLLDVLLGDPPPLPAVPALPVPTQPAPGGSSCALQDPGPLDQSSKMAHAEHDDKLIANLETTTAEPAGRPLQDARPAEAVGPRSSPPMQGAAPSPDFRAGNTLLQPEQGPVKKVLSLRERIALLKGST